MPEDPKAKLTKFLTEFNEEFPEINTAIPTPETLVYFSVYRQLGDEYHFKSCKVEADRLAQRMWSWEPDKKIGSRTEVVEALKESKPKKGFILAGLRGEEEEEEGEGKPEKE